MTFGNDTVKYNFPLKKTRNLFSYNLTSMLWCNEAIPASIGHSTNCLIWLGHLKDNCQVCIHQHMQGFYGNASYSTEKHWVYIQLCRKVPSLSEINWCKVKPEEKRYTVYSKYNLLYKKLLEIGALINFTSVF